MKEWWIRRYDKDSKRCGKYLFIADGPRATNGTTSATSQPETNQSRTPSNTSMPEEQAAIIIISVIIAGLIIIGLAIACLCYVMYGKCHRQRWVIFQQIKNTMSVTVIELKLTEHFITLDQL